MRHKLFSMAFAMALSLCLMGPFNRWAGAQDSAAAAGDAPVYCATLNPDGSLVLMPSGEIVPPGEYIVNPDGSFANPNDPSQRTFPCETVCVTPNPDGSITIHPYGDVVPPGEFIVNPDGSYSDPNDPLKTAPPCPADSGANPPEYGHGETYEPNYDPANSYPPPPGDEPMDGASRCAFPNGDGSLTIHPNGEWIEAGSFVENTDGTVGLANGEILPKCRDAAGYPEPFVECAVQNEDGSLTLMPAGVWVAPGDYIVNPDGTFSDPSDPANTAAPCPPGYHPAVHCPKIHENGDLELPDGRVFIPEDQVHNADGSIGLPNDEIVWLCPEIIECFNLDPEGAAHISTGGFVEARDVRFDQETKALEFDGRLVPECPRTPPAADCPRFNENGDLQMPDGRIFRPDEIAWNPDGSVGLPEGETVWPCPDPIKDGTVPTDADSVHDPSGAYDPATGANDGSDMPTGDGTDNPNAGYVPPDGATAPPTDDAANAGTAQCARIDPDGSLVVEPTGERLDPGTFTLNSDGSIALGDGRVLPHCPDRCALRNPDGSLTIKPTGEWIAPGTFAENPDATVGLADGAIVPLCPARQNQYEMKWPGGYYNEMGSYVICGDRAPGMEDAPAEGWWDNSTGCFHIPPMN